MMDTPICNVYETNSFPTSMVWPKWPVTACLDSSSEIFCILLRLFWGGEKTEDKVKRSVCHKIDPMDNISKNFAELQPPSFHFSERKSENESTGS